jgi:peptidyl-prolyl cis-trans isomerase C
MKPLLTDVTVNGQTIPAATIAAEAQNHPAPPGKPGLAWRAAAEALAIRALLLQEAARRGLAPARRSMGEGLIEDEDEARIRALLEDQLGQSASPRDWAEAGRALVARLASAARIEGISLTAGPRQA